MDTDSLNNIPDSNDSTKNQSKTPEINPEYQARIDPKSVIIAVVVMVPLFVAAFIGMAGVMNNTKTTAIDNISPVGHSFKEWASENPSELDSIYDQEMTFTEFAALTGNDSSWEDMNAKVTKLGENNSRICFSSSDTLFGDSYIYSTLTDKVESVEKC